MAVLIDLLALTFLIVIAYRGFSVILFAPIAAMIPLLLTSPADIPQIFTGLYLEKAASFVKLYFPIFMLGALFGKLMEVSGFARAIIAKIAERAGPNLAVVSIVIASAVLTYGGVSLFVVVFAVYPFAAELFRKADIPKRLIPATMVLGGFSFTMDALPGTPQIQNIIPTTFFGTTAWAAPWTGSVGALALAICGIAYLQWRVRRLKAAGEGYGADHLNEPARPDDSHPVAPAIAAIPLVAVIVLNKLFGVWIAATWGSETSTALPGLAAPIVLKTATMGGIWALEGALIVAVVLIVALRFRALRSGFADASKAAVAGSLLAIMNTASEYGFGGVIAALPGFAVVRAALGGIPNPLINVAVVTTSLSGVTGSASGGLSLALGALAERFVAMAHTAGIPLEVMHRIAAMASGGMDCLPHNGAIITLLAVCGLSHRQSYRDIFVVTLFKTGAVFVSIAFYYATGLA